MVESRTDWDVIIIGGGPAGSTTARYAAEGGASVLVIDEREVIGTPLQCGELIPSNEELKRLCPRVPEIDDLFRTPEEAISRRTDRLRLTPPSRKGLEYTFEGVILDRPVHDEALVELAKSCGVHYRTGKRVIHVEGSTVTCRDDGEFTAKVIVGSGGTSDPLRRRFWTEESLNIPVKFILIAGEFDDIVELHFGSSAPGGYAWVIPKADGANIGVGIQRRFSRGRSLNEFAADFFANYRGRVTFRGAGALPMSGTIKSFVKGNHVLVGDSAGMVLPSNGAGITIAMIGGRIAGQVIAEHLRNGTSLSEYESIWKQQMGRQMSNSKRSMRIAGLMFRSPDFIVNMMFNRLLKPFIWRAVTGRARFGIL